MKKSELIKQIEQNIEVCLKSQFNNLEQVKLVKSSVNLETGRLKFEVIAGEDTRNAWREALNSKKKENK